MRFTHIYAFVLATGRLKMTAALPVSTSEHPCMSTMTAIVEPSHSTLAPRQECVWPPSSSVSVYGEWSPPESALSYAEQPSAVVRPTSYSYTDMPTTTAQTQAQEENTHSIVRDKFSTSAVLATCAVVGAILVMVAIWAVIAHRNGQPLCVLWWAEERYCYSKRVHEFRHTVCRCWSPL